MILRVIPVAYAADIAAVLATETGRLLDLDIEVDPLLARHAEAHGRIYHRVQLDLRAGVDRAQPVEAGKIAGPRQHFHVHCIAGEEMHVQVR